MGGEAASGAPIDGGDTGISPESGGSVAMGGVAQAGGEAPIADAGVGGQAELPSVLEPVVALVGGQSEAGGVDKVGVLPGLPDEGVRFWLNDYWYNDGPHSFGPLTVAPRNLAFGCEIALAQRLKAAGRTVAVIKLWKGATYANRWTPTYCAASTGCPSHWFYPELSEALAALPAAFPGATSFRFVWVWDQGQEEAHAGAYSFATQWVGNYGQIRDAVLARIAAAYPTATVERFVVQTDPGIPPSACSGAPAGVTCPSVVVFAQAAVAPDPAHLIYTGDLPRLSDHVHPTGAGENTIGNRIADVVLSEP